ncbi:UDP-N-acetylglucosamine 2-epimerase [Pontimicrobium aquaticum]|uniref:CDP-glycerol glycerophosphotransferase n=1 Tax=Pontimicrobium aquaticum TaxID=2565367 RepID=A0A4U0EMY3_9FLAO|nr:UDP-N-acetylglucosamine 2-epimerase [Pontimicrobium aquaticum]TJY32861.1 CDP-glycerol glycerophosphotransferase [Pontimicrobium aquaticum]
MNYKFVIYISYSYSIPIGNPLEKEILKRGYSVKWFADIDEGKTALNEKENVINTITDLIAFSPHIILAATDSVPDFINALKVQVFHGFNAEKRPTKNNSFAHFRLRGFFDLYCTQGPNTTQAFNQLAKKHQYFEVIETGWSKVDPLFPLQEKTIKNKPPTIMVASTFTERLSLAYNNNVFNEIKKLSKSGKYNFLMVLHPKLPQEIKQKWEELNNKNFTYFNTTNLIPLFKQADIMFADTTSAIQEFLLQKKPVVTFKHTIKHNYLIDINNAEEIENAFTKALSNPKKLIYNIEKYINNLHPYFDGKSSQRIIDATLNCLQKNRKHLKNKPLNLIRKYKMRKRLKHFTFKSYNKPYTLPTK